MNAIDYVDQEQYASAAVALASQMRRASEQYRNQRLEATLQALKNLLDCNKVSDNSGVIVYVPLSTWETLTRLVDLLDACTVS